ncbi:MAG: T9SS type A sorting domain-containing protein [Melioribacteraceae bacterium]|nr:T9SS type A sorting domain-containing protein [Melioribacteraceae bacterium]
MLKKVYLLSFFLTAAVSINLSAQPVPADGAVNVDYTKTSFTQFKWTTQVGSTVFFVIWKDGLTPTAENVVWVPFMQPTESGIVGSGTEVLDFGSNPGTLLEPDTEYHWGIWEYGAVSVYDDPAEVSYTFTTAPLGFTITSPSANLSFDNWAPIDVDFEWTVPSADYNNDLEYNIVFNGADLSGTDITSPFTQSFEEEDGSYQWNISATKNAWGIPLLPERTYLSDAGTIDFNEVLISPAKEATQVGIYPKFQWKEVAGETEYTIEYGTSANNLSSSISVTPVLNGGIATYNVSEGETGFPLSNETTYFWRVTYDDAGTERFSNTWSFETVENVTLILSNPVNGGEITPYSPMMFSWYLNAVQSGKRFKLQIFKDDGATPDLADWESGATLNYDNITNLYKSISGLSGGTKYFWRLIVYYNTGTDAGSLDAEDDIVKISQTNNFTTGGGAVAATLSYPIGGSIVYTLHPTFYWYVSEYEPSATFEVLITEDDAVAGVLSTNLISGAPISSGTNKTLYLGNELEPSRTYNWQVKTIYQDQTEYSAVASFTTDAIGVVTAFKPTQSYPTAGVTVYTTAPALWYYTGGPYGELDFIIEVREQSSGTPVSGSPFTAEYLTRTVSGLTPGFTYEWRVKSYETGNSSNESDFTAWQSFTITGGGLTQAVASYPTNNPTVFSLNTTAYWYNIGSVLGFDKYIIKLYHDASLTGAPSDWASESVTATVTNSGVTWYTFSNLEPGEKYFWAVAFDNGISPNPTHGDFAEGSFTVAGGSQTQLQPTSPEDNSITYTSDPTLYWSVIGSGLGITGYRVTYSNTAAFVDDPLYTHTVESTTTNIKLTDLLPGTTYFWFVQLSYDNGVTWVNKSDTYEFTVNAGSFAVVPKIGSPDHGVQLTEGAPTLSWLLPVQSESELVYDVQIADNSEFENAQEYSDVESLNAKLSSLGEGNYFWRVRSKVANQKNANVSYYSDLGKFRIGNSVTAVNEFSNIPSEFSLEQNYPNPFNPTTTISYQLPENSFVSVKIYDILGNEIRTLVNSEQAPGLYSANWNGDDNFGNKVASGTFIYRLESGNFSETKKMILIK